MRSDATKLLMKGSVYFTGNSFYLDLCLMFHLSKSLFFENHSLWINLKLVSCTQSFFFLIATAISVSNFFFFKRWIYWFRSKIERSFIRWEDPKPNNFSASHLQPQRAVGYFRLSFVIKVSSDSGWRHPQCNFTAIIMTSVDWKCKSYS